MNKLQSLGTITALSVATVFALTQPAKAVLVNTFQFTDKDGSGTGRVPGGIVTGTITFNSLNPGDTVTGVAADSVVVDSIPSWFSSSAWNDSTGMAIGVNLTSFINGESSFAETERNSFDIVGGIIQIPASEFVAQDGTETAWLVVSSNTSNNNSFMYDSTDFKFTRDVNGSSFVFSGASTSVPFEFSPTLGLFLVGSLFGVSRYAKSRKAAKLIDN